MNAKNKMTAPEEFITDKIYLIRGQKVMLDRDLAKLYAVTTGNLNKAVQRNNKRFPADFMFKLNEEEFKVLLFQFGIAKRGGTKIPPYAFTELGIAMLSSILRSERAIEVNIQIMRVFVRLRKMLLDYTELHPAVEKLRKESKNNKQNIELVFRYLDELLKKKEKEMPRKQIGYKM